MNRWKLIALVSVALFFTAAAPAMAQDAAATPAVTWTPIQFSGALGAGLTTIGAAYGIGKLAASHVAVIGLGGIGSPALQYLVASGIGRLSLVDDDVVEHLPHQIPAQGLDDLPALRVTELAQQPLHRVQSPKHVITRE